MPAFGFALADFLAHPIDVVGDLGNQDHVGGAGEPGGEGDEAGVPAHHLDHHHALVALGGRVQLVDSLGGSLHGGVEPEGGLGAADVVVDRLGDADERDAFIEEVAGDAQRAVAPDGDQRADAVGAERAHQLLGAVVLDPGAVGQPLAPMERIAAVGGAEDGAAEVGDAADFGRTERDELLLPEEAVVAFADADAFPAAVHGREDGPADDGVEPRRVAAAGRDGDLHVSARRIP